MRRNPPLHSTAHPPPPELARAGLRVELLRKGAGYQLDLLDRDGVSVGGMTAWLDRYALARGGAWQTVGGEEPYDVAVELPEELIGKGIGKWMYKTMLAYVSQDRKRPIAFIYELPISGNAAAVRMSLAKEYVSLCVPHPTVEDLDLCVLSSIRKNPYKAAIPRVSGVAYVPNPVDLEGRHIPDRYLAGLPPALQKQRIRELTESRDAYHRGDYSELPTDVTARKMGLVKQSAYTTIAKERGIEWRGDETDMAQRALRYYGDRASASTVQKVAAAIKKSFAKGLAAWKSGGHRPGATAQNWAVARVNSLVVGGKAAWTADSKEFDTLPDAVQKKIVASLDEVMSALDAQGRKRDVAYLAVVKSGNRNNPLVDPGVRSRVQSLIYPRIIQSLQRAARSIAQRTSTNISEAGVEDLVAEAMSYAVSGIVNTLYFDDADFAGNNPNREANLTALAGIARRMGVLYIQQAARGEVDPTPRSTIRQKKEIDSAKAALRLELGREPTIADVATKVGLTADELQTKLALDLLPVRHVGEGGRRSGRGPRLIEEAPEEEFSELELVEDVEPVRQREIAEEREVLQAAIARLDPLEQQVIRAYLGQIPTASLGLNYDQMKAMVLGPRGIKRKLVGIIEERRLLGERGLLPALPPEPPRPVRAITKKNW